MKTKILDNIYQEDWPVNMDINNIQFSEREYQILKLLIIGYENRIIAKKLFVSVHTVKAYISAIMTKLNAKNRTNAAYIVLKNHILD